MKDKMLDEIFKGVKHSIDIGIAHLRNDAILNNGNVLLSGKACANFAMCDYLKLSQDKRLINSACNAMQKYGVYSAISRTYWRFDLYDEAESLLQEIFKKPVVLAPRTTLCHIAALPVVVGEKDAVILDQQVHTSVRIGSDVLKSYGVHVETIRHSDLERLEERIVELSKHHEKIWYLADGIYSMHGDVLPLEGIKALLNRYSNFYLYVDDAHGTGWSGEHGAGLLLESIGLNEKVVFTTSLGKGFGAGGGMILCNTEEEKERLLVCGAPLMFSSPLSPATLGAIIASAKIHLSDEIKKLQAQLCDLKKYFFKYALKFDLPLLSDDTTPIFFIATGKSDMAAGLCRAMLDYNCHVTGGIYPAVPFNGAGVRPVISCYQTKEEIAFFIERFRDEYDKSLLNSGIMQREILTYYARKNILVGRELIEKKMDFS